MIDVLDLIISRLFKITDDEYEEDESADYNNGKLFYKIVNNLEDVQEIIDHFKCKEVCMIKIKGLDENLLFFILSN